MPIDHGGARKLLEESFAQVAAGMFQGVVRASQRPLSLSGSLSLLRRGRDVLPVSVVA